MPQCPNMFQCCIFQHSLHSPASCFDIIQESGSTKEQFHRILKNIEKNAPSQSARLTCFHLSWLSMGKRTKNVQIAHTPCMAYGWNLASASLSNKIFSLHPWGMRGPGHEVGVEVDNCQESGSVRVQGQSGATPTSIYVYCTTEHHRHPSLYSTGLHRTLCALHCIGSLHNTLEWGPTKVYKPPGQARFSLNVTEWY